MHTSILQSIIILLGVAVVAVAVFHRLRLPPILAYLLVGVLVGPNALGWISSSEDTRLLAEFGVVFLLFTIGLEFSLPKLQVMKGIVFGLGGAQVVLTVLAAGLGAWLLGAPLAGAFAVGGILAMSSTAIVTRQLAAQLELDSRHGRLAVGVLLFQDLAAIPLLVLIPALAIGSGDGVAISLGWTLAKGALVCAAMLVAGRWLLRPLVHEVAQAHSAELFTLTVLLVSLTAAWLTGAAGLSLALGGFLAGMMLGETEFRHQVENDIRPFQDVLLGLFFITIGMLVDPRALLEIWPWVLLVTAGIVILKTLLVFALARLFGNEPGVALRGGVVLAQGGEFGFALLALALGGSLLTPEASQTLLLAIVLSMALAPLLIRNNGWFAKTFCGSYLGTRTESIERIEDEARHLKDHVIICGYGRVGQSLAHLLDREGIPCVALDLDPLRLREAVQAGERVFYADSTQPGILEAVGLGRARLLVISYDHPAAALKILEHTRQRRPDMPVLVRTRDEANLEVFQAAGATEVVPETLEASLMLGAHMLLLLKMPVSRIIRMMEGVRSDRYRLLRGYFHGEQETTPLDSADTLRAQLHAVTLPEKAYAVNRTLAELQLEKTGVRVNAVRRGGIRGPEPDPTTRLHAGDVLVLYGTPENLERAEARLLSG